MEKRASAQSRQAPPAKDLALDSALVELARLPSGLPPLFATASYNGDDPKYKRVSLPLEYREPLVKRFGNRFRPPPTMQVPIRRVTRFDPLTSLGRRHTGVFSIKHKVPT